jgi:hypothetical protein
LFETPPKETVAMLESFVQPKLITETGRTMARALLADGVAVAWMQDTLYLSSLPKARSECRTPNGAQGQCHRRRSALSPGIAFEADVAVLETDALVEPLRVDPRFAGREIHADATAIGGERYQMCDQLLADAARAQAEATRTPSMTAHRPPCWVR